jgi:hypothetical protein
VRHFFFPRSLSNCPSDLPVRSLVHLFSFFGKKLMLSQANDALQLIPELPTTIGVSAMTIKIRTYPEKLSGLLMRHVQL